MIVPGSYVQFPFVAVSVVVCVTLSLPLVPNLVCAFAAAVAAVAAWTGMLARFQGHGQLQQAATPHCFGLPSRSSAIVAVLPVVAVDGVVVVVVVVVVAAAGGGVAVAVGAA